MQHEYAPVRKADEMFSPSLEHDSASPECGSTSAVSTTWAYSSGASLMCTEDDLDDCDMEDRDAFGDEVRELCTNFRAYSGHQRRILPRLSHRTDALTLGGCIRDDLQSQAQLRQSRTTNGQGLLGCSMARAAPYISAADTAGCQPPGRSLPPATRARMVGWMREVSEALGLHPSTLFAATSVLDRFVAADEILLPAEGLLQLLALTCMSVAVKYNEVRQLSPAVWLGLAVDESGRRLYEARDLQRYEFTLLQAIEWRLHDPTIFTFLEHFLLCQPYGCATTLAAQRLHGTTSCSGSNRHWTGGQAASTDSNRAEDIAAVAAAAAAVAAAATAAAASGEATGVVAAASDVQLSDPSAFAQPLWPAPPAPALGGPAEGEEVKGEEGEEDEEEVMVTAAEDELDAAALAAAAAAVPASCSCCCCCCLPAVELVAELALGLAEVSRIFSGFMSYEYSTVALACVTLAERMAYDNGGGAGPAAGLAEACGSTAAAAADGAGTAATAAAAAAGLPLDLLAPGLESCVQDLERCYGQLMRATAEVAAAAAEWRQP